MITINDIKRWSQPHPIGGSARRTLISNDAIEFSIVGGEKGLYGDFDKTFEVAIFDNETGEFITRFFQPDNDDDVIPYMDGEDLEKLVNKLIREKDFQVR